MRSAISSGCPVPADSGLGRKLQHCLVKRHIVRGSVLLHVGFAAIRKDRAWENAVDLYTILDASLGEGTSHGNDCGIDRCHRRVSGFGSLGGIARGEDDGALRLLQGVPSVNCDAPRTMQFQSHPVIPLGIRHLEEIDLRNSASDIHKGIDPSKSFQRLITSVLSAAGSRRSSGKGNT